MHVCRYHPFYITDSSEGGFGQKSEAQQRRQNVYAGVEYDDERYPYPTAGEFNWIPNQLLIFLYLLFPGNSQPVDIVNGRMQQSTDRMILKHLKSMWKH